MSFLDSDSSFQQILNSRMGENSITTDEDLRAKITNLSKINKKATRILKEKKHELAAVKESQGKHEEMFRETINQLESDNQTLIKELNKRMALVDKVTKLFYELASDNINFTQYPEINYEELVNICGLPPQSRAVGFDPTPSMKRNLDPIALKIATNDPYFQSITNNDEFVDKCMKLVSEHQEAKETKPQYLSETVSRLQSRNSISETRVNCDEMKTQITTDSQNEIKQQKQFADELKRLLAEKQKLINEISEEKKKIKERQEHYQQQNDVPPTKTVIKLRMATPTRSSITSASLNNTTELNMSSTQPQN